MDFTTTDIGCACALICSGHKLDQILPGKIITFCFAGDAEQIKEDDKKYWGGEMNVNALEIMKEFTSLRARFNSVKNAG